MLPKPIHLRKSPKTIDFPTTPRRTLKRSEKSEKAVWGEKDPTGKRSQTQRTLIRDARTAFLEPGKDILKLLD